ncbi:MAG: phosphatase domain-containing protein [Pseudomonadota bacterium]
MTRLLPNFFRRIENLFHPAPLSPTRDASTTTETLPEGDRFSPDGHASPLPSTQPPAGTVTSPLGARLSAMGVGAQTDVATVQARIETLLASPTEKPQEAEVLGLLRGSGGQALDQLVQQLDLSRLVEAMDDRWFGPDNREALLDLLTDERVGDLSTDSRARLITALQRGETPRQSERAIESLFLATTGSELTALKNAIDAGGDHRDLLQLLHHDIDAGGIRRRILRHIEAQAPARQPGRLKVLSDIDDTFYANLKDKRFPSKTVYPGVRSFYEALAGERMTGGGAEARVGFLTARPEDPTGLIEDETLRMLRERGVDQAMVLSGDIGHVVGNEEIAEKKRENFDQFAALYPEYGFVFVGDSGQGDALLAQGLTADHGGQVPATFIHDVVGLPETQRASLAAQGVMVFDTYAGAALAAHNKGLIGLPALTKVARDSVAELKAVSFGDAAQRTARFEDLGRDLVAINALLPTDQQIVL